jgi:hypothetical protein
LEGDSTNIVDLFWAKSVGGADLGLHLNYGETFGATLQNESFGLSAGLGFSNVGAFSEFNIHADYLTESETDSGIVPVMKSGEYYSAMLGCLAVSPMDPKSDLRLFLDGSLDQRMSYGVNWADDTVDLGASITHKLNGNKDMISSGLILDYWDANTNGMGQKVDDWAVLWNGSVEAQASGWLTLRAGVAKALVVRYYNSWSIPPYVNGATPGVAFCTGFGINWQEWTLDTSLNVGDFENSISNVQPGSGLFYAGNLATVSEATLRFKF